MQQYSPNLPQLFIKRFLATLIDMLLISFLVFPFLNRYISQQNYTPEALFALLETQGITAVIPATVLHTLQFAVLAVTVFFWVRYAGTPGKHLLKLKVVHAQSGEKLTLLWSIARYLGYTLSALPMFLGYFWALWDDKGQAWHDKLSNSRVVSLDDPLYHGGKEPTAQSTTHTITKDDDQFAA